MIEVFIAGLISFGVLSAGGVITDSASTAPSESPPVASVSQSAPGGIPLDCADAGPRYRDLTIPYAAGEFIVSQVSERRGDCSDG